MRSTRLAALAALSMMVGTTAAVAQSAAPASISAPAARAGGSIEGASALDGDGREGAYILGAVAVGIIGVVLYLLISNDGDENSDSP